MKITGKEVSFWVIGILTMSYVVVELGIALAQHSLTLLSDGFHNLSDVIALLIAFWASQASRRGISDKMSYGWARTEILGALTNGVFLLSLCLYTSLEAIPKIISPGYEDSSGLYFVSVAAAGFFINTIGTVVFAITGQAHGHSHGSHGHSHGDHGHSHGDHAHEHVEDSDHDDHEEHSHKDSAAESLVSSHHGHSHGQKPKKKMDMNVRAVFLHYLGDMVSSLFVLIAGILMMLFPAEDHPWVAYIDPVTSLIICVLILATTLPLVRSCLGILLQGVPKHINLKELKKSIHKIEGVLQTHDFHAWQLTDGMVITSLHVVCQEGCDFAALSNKIKKVLHKHGIHSTAIQPEFVAVRQEMNIDSCQQNCVEDCAEDWCCKDPVDSEIRTSQEVQRHSFGHHHEEI